MTTNYRIHNETSGLVLGVYAGESEMHAIAVMLRDAGYKVSIEDDEIVFPANVPDAARDLSDLVSEEWVPEIEVCETISGADLGDDEDWQERVRATCEAEIESALLSAYPDSEIKVTVEVGTRSDTTVSLDAEHQQTYENIKRVVRDASQRGFDKAC